MHIGILKKAIEEAEKSTYKQRLGAVLFKGKRIISSGHNQIRSSSIKDRYKVWLNSLHAEQNCLNGLDWSKLSGYSMLIIRLTKDNRLTEAYPCTTCMKLLEFVGLKSIRYSTWKGEIVHKYVKLPT